jgi:hypothetical protein
MFSVNNFEEHSVCNKFNLPILPVFSDYYLDFYMQMLHLNNNYLSFRFKYS